MCDYVHRCDDCLDSQPEVSSERITTRLKEIETKALSPRIKYFNNIGTLCVKYKWG